MDNQGTAQYQAPPSFGAGFNTNINRFVPGGYVVGPNVNQRGYVRTVTPGDPGRNSIQAAINEASRLGGGVVNITRGTYTILNNISMLSNVHLVGQNPLNTTFDFNGGTNQIQSIGTSGNGYIQDVSIENIEFTGRRTGTNTEGNQSNIFFNYVNNAIIKNCIFTDNWNSLTNQGLDMEIGDSGGFPRNIVVEDCKILNSGGLIITASASYLRNCFFGTCNNVAIKAGIASNIKITNNHFLSCGSYFLESHDEGDWVGGIFSNNTISNQLAVGFKDNSTEGCIFANNKISAGTGIEGHCFSCSSAFSKNIVVGNFIQSFSGDGINMPSGAILNTITANIFDNNGGTGVGMASGANENAISSNIFNANGGTISNGGTGNILTGNVPS